MLRSAKAAKRIFRGPKPSYVSLFWLGPQGAVVVPVINQKIPAHRDVRIDSGGIIVAPFGKERWVAINTTERIPISCESSQHAHMALFRMLKTPHGVGHWTVQSGLKPPQMTESRKP